MARELAMVSVWGSSSSLRKLVLRHATEFLVLWWLGTTNTPPAHMTSSGSCDSGRFPYDLLPAGTYDLLRSSNTAHTAGSSNMQQVQQNAIAVAFGLKMHCSCVPKTLA